MTGEILLIEDHEDLATTLRKSLREEGYHVRSAADGQSGLAALRKQAPELVLLDIKLPGVDGLELCRSIRRSSSVPIVFLTAKKSEADRIVGLKLGADDYVTKPFSTSELLARIEAVLRRARREREAGSGPLVAGDVRLEPETHEVRVAGEPRLLTPKEFQLLKLLMEAGGKVVSRRQLLARVWGIGPSVGVDTRTVEQHLVRLRQKLRPRSEVLATVRNYGYRIAAEPGGARERKAV